MEIAETTVFLNYISSYSFALKNTLLKSFENSQEYVYSEVICLLKFEMERYYYWISHQISSSEQFCNYSLMKMFEIIILIKRNVLDWKSINQKKKKKKDTFQIPNSWNTLYLFLSIQLAFQFSAQWTIYRLCVQALTTTTFFCFPWRI